MKKISLTLFFVILIILPLKLNAQFSSNDIIINEFYLNPSTPEGKEYVELIVTKDHLDLRGVRLSDVSTKNGAGGTAEGHITFPNENFLADVPRWTIITVVLQTPLQNFNILPQDTDISDGQLVLLSKGVPGGILDTIGRLDIATNDNIEVLSNGTAAAFTIDFIATGNNNSHINFADATWNTNLEIGQNRTVTFFTNSFGGSLINDNANTGWLINKDSTFKSPGTKNPGQILPSVNFPPVIVDVYRSAYVPQTNKADTVYCHATDNAGIAESNLYYTINDVQTFTVAMTLMSGSTLDGIYRGVIPANVHTNGTRVKYYVEVMDDNTQPLYNVSDDYGYFAGTSFIDAHGIKLLGGSGFPKYNGYAVRVRGTATVGSGMFSPTDLDVYVQDDSGGINVFVPGELPAVTMENAYNVIGTIGSYNGRARISLPGFSLEQTTGAAVVVPRILSIDSYLVNPEYYEGSVIRFQSCTILDGDWPETGSDADLRITDGTSETRLFIDADSEIGNYPEPSYPVNFSGIAFQIDTASPYDANYGIMLRVISDITAGAVNQPPVITDVARDIAVPENHQDVTVSATITDEGEVTQAFLVYIKNDTQRDSVVMNETGTTRRNGKRVATFSAIIPGVVHAGNNHMRYYVRAVDDGVPALVSKSNEGKYIIGTTFLSSNGVKKTNANGELLFSGYTIKIEGLITVGSGVISTDNLDCFIQDDSGAIRIFLENGGVQNSLTEGGMYSIIGTLTSVHGNAQLSAPYFSIDTSFNLIEVEPITVKLSELYASPEQYEGRLMRLQQCSHLEGEWPPDPIESELIIQTPENLIGTIFLFANGDFALHPEPTFPIDVVGTIIQNDETFPYTDGYKIQPRRFTDFTEVAPDFPPLPFSLLLPEEDATIGFVGGDEFVEFNWMRSEDPEHQQIKYKIVFASDSSFSTILSEMSSERNGSDSVVTLTGIQAQTLLNTQNFPGVDRVLWRIDASDGNYATRSNEIYRVHFAIENSFPTTFDLESPTSGTSLILSDSVNATPLNFSWSSANDPDENDILKYYLVFSESPTFDDNTMFVPTVNESGDTLIEDFSVALNPLQLYNKYLGPNRDSVTVYWIMRVVDSYYQAHAVGSNDTVQLLLHKVPVGMFAQNGVIINEFIINPVPSNGKEFIELLVAKKGVVDLRNLRISDVDEKGGSGTSNEGHLDFPNVEYLQNLPFGTRIVIVLSTPESNPNLFTQDIDPSDSVLILFSKGLPNGVMDTSGVLDIDHNENIVLLSGNTMSTSTLDFVATGINSTLTNYPDANWNINLANSNNGNITYFTNSALGGLINDDTTGWKSNKSPNQRTPGLINPNQICGTLGDTPPVFVSHARRPYVPDPDVRDSVLAVISDNILVAEANLHLTINGGDEQVIPMAEVNHNLKIWGAVIDPDLNQEGNRLSYYITATDNNGLQTISQKSGYFVGLKQLSFNEIRSVDSLGVAKYLNYGVRVQGAATVSDHVFATNRLDAYIQDEQGGINLFVPQSAGGDTLRIIENFPYTIEGTLIQFRGKLEISSPGFKKINDGGIAPRTPIDLTIEEYNASPELFEGSLIRFQNVVKDSGDWPLPTFFSTIKISDGTGSSVLFIDNDTDLDDFPEPQYPLSVIGIASQFGNQQPPFTSGYQIIPRRRADIVAAGSPLGFDLVFPENETALQFIHGNSNAQFVWNAAVDPDNDTLRYKIIFGADSTFIPPLEIISSEQNGLLASFQLTGTKAETYIDKIMPNRDSVGVYWRVLVQDPSGNIVLSNQIRKVSLVVRNARPAPFTLVAPLNNNRIVVPDSAGATPLAMKWKKSVDANIQDTVFYYVLFCENKGFADSTLFSPNLVGNNLIMVKDTFLNVSRQKLRQKYFNILPRDSVRVYWVVRARDVFGTAHEIASTDTFRLTLRKNSLRVTEQDLPIPKVFSLSQNFPNPFNPTTTINFGLPKESYATLKIFNLLGEEIADIVNENLEAGNYTVEWNASTVPSGIYFYRLQAGEFVQTKKLILLK